MDRMVITSQNFTFCIEMMPVPGSLPVTSSSRCASSWLREDEFCSATFSCQGRCSLLESAVIETKDSNQIVQSFQLSLYEFTYYYLDYLQYGSYNLHHSIISLQGVCKCLQVFFFLYAKASKRHLL